MGGCATPFHTGGAKEVEEVLVEVGVPFGVFCCYLPMGSVFMKQHQKEFGECDAVLTISCGGGLQAVRAFLKEEFEIKPAGTVHLLFKDFAPPQLEETVNKERIRKAIWTLATYPTG